MSLALISSTVSHAILASLLVAPKSRDASVAVAIAPALSPLSRFKAVEGLAPKREGATNASVETIIAVVIARISFMLDVCVVVCGILNLW